MDPVWQPSLFDSSIVSYDLSFEMLCRTDANILSLLCRDHELRRTSKLLSSVLTWCCTANSSVNRNIHSLVCDVPDGTPTSLILLLTFLIKNTLN